MRRGRITQCDLDWWLEFAATRQWSFARTYAATAPHDYLVADRSPGVSPDDIVRAARVICTFGTPGKYYAVTKIYLTSPDGRHRWWTEDRHFTDATLVNRGPMDVLYGVQNAPATDSGIASTFDELATTWDAEHLGPDEQADRLKPLLEGVRGRYPPHVLDLGCGTGQVLDLGLVAPQRYAAVDSSRAMLNVMIRKHPGVAAVYPADVRDLLEAGTFTVGQFDWVFLDAAVELDAQQRSQAEQIARLGLITHREGEWVVRDVSELSLQSTRALATKLRTSY